MASSTGDTTSHQISNVDLPLLPRLVEPIAVTLKKSCEDESWGFVLRGYHTKFPDGSQSHAALVADVMDQSPSAEAGLADNDQIVAVDGESVKMMEHKQVVEMFRGKKEVELLILSEDDRVNITVQVLPLTVQMLDCLWALSQTLQFLFIWHIDMSDPDNTFDVSGLSKLKELAINHCKLSTLEHIHGLPSLHSLTSLSLDHNNLPSDALSSDSSLVSMIQLTKLSVNHNKLSSFPSCLLLLTNLTKLSLSFNHITAIPPLIPTLVGLKQLSLDSNRIIDLEPEVLQLPHLRSLTISDNLIENEPEGLVTCQLDVLRVEGNPYVSQMGMMAGRSHRRIQRTISVTGPTPVSHTINPKIVI